MIYNHANELNDFKTQINLASYLEHMGFTYDQKKSSRNIPVFRGKSEYEVFVVSKKPNNHHVYMNPYNDSDSGTIIDFIQNRRNLNLGEVRKELRSYLGNVLPIKNYHNYKEASPKDYASLRASFTKATKITDRSFLHSRGISDDVLDSAFLKDRVGSQRYIHSTGEEFINTVFPIYNTKGLAGLERRNQNFKQAAENSDKSFGMWVSSFAENPHTHKVFFIAESPIDCISYFQLNDFKKDDLDTLFFSSNGSLNKGQFDLVQKYIDLCEPNKVFLGNDNDTAGQRFNVNYLGNLKDVKRTFEQDHVSFFLKPVQGDKLNLQCEVFIKGEGKDHDKIAYKMYDEIENLLGKIWGVEQNKTQEGIVIQFQIKNDKEAIQQVKKMVHKIRPVKVCEEKIPLSKDFNEDLMKAKEQSQEQVSDQKKKEGLVKNSDTILEVKQKNTNKGMQM
jgi:hypothetical protein